MVQQTTTTWRWWWWRAAAMMMVILMDTGNRWWSMWCEKRWPLLVTRYGGRLLYLRYCFVRGAAHIEPFFTTHTNSDSHPIQPANVDMIWVSEQCKTFPLWPSESCCSPCSARPRTTYRQNRCDVAKMCHIVDSGWWFDYNTAKQCANKWIGGEGSSELT